MSGILMEAVRLLSRLSLADEAVLTTDPRWGSFIDLPFDLFTVAGFMLLRLKMRVMKFEVLPFLLSFPAACLRLIMFKSSKLLEVFIHAFPSASSSSEAFEEQWSWWGCGQGEGEGRREDRVMGIESNLSTYITTIRHDVMSMILKIHEDKNTPH